MSQELFGHVFTTYDEMVQESIDWYARGLREWKAVKREREKKAKAELARRAGEAACPPT